MEICKWNSDFGFVIVQHLTFLYELFSTLRGKTF